MKKVGWECSQEGVVQREEWTNIDWNLDNKKGGGGG